MSRMSPKLLVSALASTIAMAAFAVGAPDSQSDAHESAGSSPIMATMPAPSFALPALLPR